MERLFQARRVNGYDGPNNLGDKQLSHRDYFKPLNVLKS